MEVDCLKVIKCDQGAVRAVRFNGSITVTFVQVRLTVFELVEIAQNP